MDYEQKLFLEELNALLDKYQVKIEGWHEMRVAIDGPDIGKGRTHSLFQRSNHE